MAVFLETDLQINIIVLLGRWFWKCHSLRRQRSSSQYNIFTQKVVLKRLFSWETEFESVYFSDFHLEDGLKIKATWLWYYAKRLGTVSIDIFLARVLHIGVVVLKGTDFQYFLLWEGLIVLKGLIVWQFPLWEGMVGLKDILTWGMWWSWRHWFWVIPNLRGCGGLERTGFEQFPPWEGIVVLNQLILNNLTWGCGSLEMTDFG